MDLMVAPPSSKRRFMRLVMIDRPGEQKSDLISLGSAYPFAKAFAEW
jgi:hypothetical protein